MKLTEAQKSKILTYQKPACLRWIMTCIANWLIIFVTFLFAYHYPYIWVYVLVVFVIGNRQHAIALLGHEGSHYTLSTNRTWNDFLTGALSYWPMGVSLAGYREFHFKHHQYVGTKNDPELEHKSAFAPGYELPISRTKMVLFFLKDMLCLSSNEVILALKFFTPKNKIHLFIPIIFLGTIIASLIYFGFFWVVVLWFISIYTSFWAFFRIRIYIEHVGTTQTHRVKINQILKLIFFPHGADTHWEHHMWPNILYYQRDKVREIFPDPNLIGLEELFEMYEETELNYQSKKQTI